MRMYRPRYLGKKITRREYLRMIIGRIKRYIREMRLREKNLKIIDLRNTPTKLGIILFKEFGLRFKVKKNFSLEKGSVIFYPLEDFLNFCLENLFSSNLKKLKEIYFPFCKIPREEIKILAEKFGLDYRIRGRKYDWFIEKLFEIGPTIKFSWVNGFYFLINNS